VSTRRQGTVRSFVEHRPALSGPEAASAPSAPSAPSAQWFSAPSALSAESVSAD
jgi:hypothetical protein